MAINTPRAGLVSRFQRHGIAYRDPQLDKSQAFLEIEPLFAEGKIEVLDNPQLIRELRMLERRAQPGGKTKVSAPRGHHDDYANSLALAAAKVAHIQRGWRPIPLFSEQERRELRQAEEERQTAITFSFDAIRRARQH